MGDFKKHFENLQEKISSYFVGNDKPLSKKEITLKKLSMSIKSVPVICMKSVPLEIKNFSPYYPSVFLNFFIR